ncbi:hypothetical protein QE152_g10453 [Popillia japonica]|uniref:Uncharacterized protein n=1 Tax=Popillia japonica TaxID=7064 RepID=A0AAW1LV86_POPJA
MKPKHRNIFRRDHVPITNPKRLTQNEFDALAQALFEEESEEEIGGELDSSSEEEIIEESDRDIESEIELNDKEFSSSAEESDHSEKSESDNDEYFIGKDKITKWYKNPVVSKFSKTSSKNIVKILPGLRQCARDVTNERSAFQKIFSDDIIDNIVECTNL